MTENIIGGGEQPGEPSSYWGDQRQTGPGIETVMNGGEATKQLCLWPTEKCSIHSMWVKLRAVLCEDSDRVRRVVEVSQRENVSRFDLLVDLDSWVRVLTSLRRAKHQHRWWVREHVNYYRRIRRGMVGNLSRREAAAARFVKMSTWNIHSIASKRQELELYLKISGVKLLGLQETYRGVGDWPIYLRDHQVFESMAEGGRVRGGVGGGGRSQNGLALVIHKSLVAYELGAPSPYMVGARVMIGNLEWTVLNVYLPPRGYAVRRTAVSAVRHAVRAVFARDLEARLLIMGDWNTSPEGVSKLLGRWRQPLGLVRCSGNPESFHGPRSWSAIDHFVVSNEFASLVRRAKVNRSWDLSDHWPVECTVKGHFGEIAETTGEEAGEGIRLDVPMLEEKKQEIISHNVWNALLDLEDTDIDDLPTLLESSVKVVAEETRVGRVAGRAGARDKPTYRLSKKAKQAILRRRKAYVAWVELGEPLRGGPLWTRYLVLRARAQRLKKASMQQSWIRHIESGSRKVSDNDLGGFWRWANNIMHRGKSGPSDLGPLYSDGDTLVYSPGDKLRAWKGHYEVLLGDGTGHSRDAEFWAQRWPGQPAPELPGLNDPIVWREVNRALGKLKAGKAPGRDGIPPEFYKLAFERNEVDLTHADEPQSALGRVILKLVRTLWDRSRIPDQWNEAWVVSILKKGDPKRMTNYRGISLLVVVVKILTVVIVGRLSEALESTGWFIPQQAGFRTREECLGHVCALYEILRRRCNSGRRTYVAFIDFEKAYDTVPIEGILRKLYLAGVSGKCLEFFRGLYANATVRVRTRCGMSEPIRVLRGLRQGCNASPLLFDVFINDILAGCEHLGVRVMGLAGDGREVGLLFADDLALMSSSRSRLRRAMELIQSWADTNEMRFGVAKCGVMGFGPRSSDLLSRDSSMFRLGGQPVPVVDSYVYLGVPFTPSLDLESMASARAEKGRKVLNSFRGVLSCVRIPLSLRVKVVRAILLPVLTYGGVVWGMAEPRSRGPQRVLAETLRLLVSLRPRNSLVSAATLGLELGIPPIYATVCAARARGYLKYGELRTTIAQLVRHTPVSRLRSWVTQSRQWLLQYCPEASELTADAVARRVKDLVWQRMCRSTASGGGKSLEVYESYQLLESRSYLDLGVRYPRLARGFHWLTRLRLGSFWTARRFARIGWLAEEFRTRCPFCRRECGGEDERHFLLECASWHEPRESFLSGWTFGMEATWFNLLGGSRASSGVSGETIRSLWCPRDGAFHPEMDSPEEGAWDRVDDDVGTPGCVRVAQFLQQVMPLRLRVLGPLLEAPRADADIQGMAVLAGTGAEAATADPDPVDAHGGLVIPG